jgi:hypothetical protein
MLHQNDAAKYRRHGRFGRAGWAATNRARLDLSQEMEPMERIPRWKVLAALSVALLAASIATGIPRLADAGSAYSTTGGCSGWGMTYIISTPDDSYSKTDATQTGGCNNVFSHASFWDGSSWNDVATGWKSGSFAISERQDYTYQVFGSHNMCNTSQSCGSIWATSAP